MTNIFKPDYQNYDGVRPINIYVLRVFFILMFAVMGFTTWSNIITHQGDWKPMTGVASCMWAAYAVLSLFGIYNTLKMLPIMLFMIFYKSLWLIVVAYPLWKIDKLVGSPSEEMATIFIWVIVPALFFPWKYFFNHYILPSKK
jgi:hypothetical protein